jgi:serine phosphatase RsbU (regulator of sigma subunit)
MPGMDGYEVCKTLKTNEKTREIPVIFLTANTDSESIIRGFEVGANDYITKPFNMGEMLARVKTHLALKKSKDDIARLLLDIESKNRLITSSIEYAQTIQQALLPDDDRLDQLLPEHFILYHPKDIVSGDFYWVRQADGSVLVAAVDCTGHGVPGAFMSILGLSFLNEVTRSKYCCPANILDQVREKVKHALKQKGEFAEQRDGMDIALVQLGNDHRSLKYAGAYNPLYLVREGVLTEYKGDRQPVAIHYREKPFTNHTVDLLPGDSFYIFSDGFADQIGGEHDRKLMSGTFKEWLREIAGEPMQKQKMILEERIRTWQGDNEQTDDILVIGMKV